MKVPFHLRLCLHPQRKFQDQVGFTPVSTTALSKSNDLCHTAKVEDKTYEDRREQGAGHLYTLIEPGNVEVGLDNKTRKQLDFLGSEEQNFSGASRQVLQVTWSE